MSEETLLSCPYCGGKASHSLAGYAWCPICINEMGAVKSYKWNTRHDHRVGAACMYRRNIPYGTGFTCDIIRCGAEITRICPCALFGKDK